MVQDNQTHDASWEGLWKRLWISGKPHFNKERLDRIVRVFLVKQ